MRGLRVLLVGLLVAVFSMLGMHAAEASTTRCFKKSDTVTKCYTVSNVVRHRVYTQTVSLENHSNHTVTEHCAFTDTITRSMTAGIDVSHSVKVDVMKVADATVSMTLHLSVSQTASQATTAAGDVTLKPGERVFCHRTYASITSKVHSWVNYGPDHNRDNKYYKVRIPARMGIDFTE